MRFRFSAALLMMMAAVGCAPSGPKPDTSLIPVTGTVKVDGTAVDKGTVQFVSKDGKSVFTGQIAQGAYALRADATSPGAKPGDYEVAIVAWESEPTMDAAGKPVEGKRAVPEKYFTTKTSGLTAKVESGQKPIDFDLKK